MDDHKNTIFDMLIRKIGMEKITFLLEGKCYLHESRPDNNYNLVAIRCLKEKKDLFLEREGDFGEEDCRINAGHLLTALHDAGNEMSYSNWHNDKFSICAEIVLRYCEEHGIDTCLTRIKEEPEES